MNRPIFAAFVVWDYGWSFRFSLSWYGMNSIVRNVFDRLFIKQEKLRGKFIFRLTKGGRYNHGGKTVCLPPWYNLTTPVKSFLHFPRCHLLYSELLAFSNNFLPKPWRHLQSRQPHCPFIHLCIIYASFRLYVFSSHQSAFHDCINRSKTHNSEIW